MVVRVIQNPREMIRAAENCLNYCARKIVALPAAAC